MNKVYYYAAIFHKEENGYSVWVNDIPGCNSQGNSFTEAVSNIKDAIGLYYEEYKSENKDLPLSSEIANIKLEPNETAVLIEFDVLKYIKRYNNRAVKKTLSIPSWLNVIAEEHNINFSSVLQTALKEKLNLQ